MLPLIFGIEFTCISCQLPVLGSGQLVGIHADHGVVEPLQMEREVRF